MNSTALKPQTVHPVVAHLLCDVYWYVCRRRTRLEIFSRSLLKMCHVRNIQFTMPLLSLKINPDDILT
jgi:hypothetical protein